MNGDRASKAVSGSSRRRRHWWWLGALVVLLVVFSWLEGLVRHDASDGRTTAADPATARPPQPPEVRRLAGGGIEIRHATFETLTIRVEDDAKEEAIHDCLVRRIAETFASGTENWNRGRVERETLQIQFDCLRSVQESAAPPTGSPAG